MISWLTILLFFTYLWGLGFAVTSFFKKPENSPERFFFTVMMGLAAFPLAAIIINFLRIPLDWKIFLALSIAYPLYVLAKKIKAEEIKANGVLSSLSNFLSPSKFLSGFQLTKSHLIFCIIFLIFSFSFFMYLKGAFSYPYLEDEDPWGHSVGVKYVAMEKIAYDPEIKGVAEIDYALSYIDPYPPAYNILLGILHQTSPDLKWTIKFFNALIISLGFIFFYLFAQQLLGNKNKALLATFIFASIPSYLGHFIWAHSLVITIFFPTVYAFLKIKENKGWAIPASIFVGSIWVSQNIEQPLKITTMLLLFFIVASVSSKKFLKYEFSAIIGGIFLSFFWWGAIISKYGFSTFLGSYKTGVVGANAAAAVSAGFFHGSLQKASSFIISALKTVTNPGGTASRAYTMNDFVFAQGLGNQINTPIGIGLAVSILTLLGIIYLLWRCKSSLTEEDNFPYCLLLFWLIFAFWAVNGVTFPISVAKGAFRAWFLLAIPVAFIAAEGIYFLKAFAKSNAVKIIVISFAIFGIFFTSAMQKYEHNTIPWPASGSFTHPAEPWEYAAWFDTIPLNTKVFLYSPRDKLAIGLNGFSCDWCQNVIDFRKQILFKTAEELHSFLKQNGYEYLLVNGRMDRKYFAKTFGDERTNELLPRRYDELTNNKKLFTLAYQKGDLFAVLKVS